MERDVSVFTLLLFTAAGLKPRYRRGFNQMQQPEKHQNCSISHRTSKQRCSSPTRVAQTCQTETKPQHQLSGHFLCLRNSI